MTRIAGHYRWDELPLDKITEMVSSKAIVGGASTVTQTYFKKGARVPVHAHPAELVIYVMQGALRVRMDADLVTVREGEVLVVPPGTAHETEALDDTFLISFTTGT